MCVNVYPKELRENVYMNTFGKQYFSKSDAGPDEEETMTVLGHRENRTTTTVWTPPIRRIRLIREKRAENE